MKFGSTNFLSKRQSACRAIPSFRQRCLDGHVCKTGAAQRASSRRRCLLRVYRSRGPTQTSLDKITECPAAAAPHYRPGLEWILGVAFPDTLTRPVRLTQGFTFVRCCGSARASTPHGLTAPALTSRDGGYCVQLPPARGCYHLAPRRTFTSNPVPMPGKPGRATPSLRRDSGGAFSSCL